MSNVCRVCASDRMVTLTSHIYSVHLVVKNVEHVGELPSDFGMGLGEYIELDYCLDCGQIQGTFPLPFTALEKVNL